MLKGQVGGLDSLEHLKPLFEPSPTGAARLVAVWHGLQVETQIKILQELDSINYHFAYLGDRVREKALGSPNAYVRYLAAREFVFGNSDKEEEKRDESG